MSTPPGAATGARRPVGRDNIFTRKLGPLPMWAWLAIATAIVVAWAWWKNRSSPAASTSSTTDASQVPQFVNQTYVSPAPPSTPGTENPPDSNGPTAPPPLVIPPEPPMNQPPATDTGDGSGGNPTTKVPVSRKHPTHDAGQDKRQGARQEARQDTRQAARGTTPPASAGVSSVGVQRPPAAPAPRTAAEKRKAARIAARRKG